MYRFFPGIREHLVNPSLPDTTARRGSAAALLLEISASGQRNTGQRVAR